MPTQVCLRPCRMRDSDTSDASKIEECRKRWKPECKNIQKNESFAFARQKFWRTNRKKEADVQRVPLTSSSQSCEVGEYDLDRLALAQRMQLSQMRPTGVVGKPFAKPSNHQEIIRKHMKLWHHQTISLSHFWPGWITPRSSMASDCARRSATGTEQREEIWRKMDRSEKANKFEEFFGWNNGVRASLCVVVSVCYVEPDCFCQVQPHGHGTPGGDPEGMCCQRNSTAHDCDWWSHTLSWYAWESLVRTCLKSTRWSTLFKRYSEWYAACFLLSVYALRSFPWTAISHRYAKFLDMTGLRVLEGQRNKRKSYFGSQSSRALQEFRLFDRGEICDLADKYEAQVFVDEC